MRRSEKLIIVEDQLSAYRIAPYYHSLALLGTNLNEDKIVEIIETTPRYKEVYLCLDNDATYEAIKLQIKWRSKLPEMQVLGLPKDIKDMREDELDYFRQRIG